jgi:threonine synthase
MATQTGDNVGVLAIKGNFDDAQSGVKAIFADGDMSKALDEKGFFLSSANSINWGRLVPQIVYYVSAYCDMMSQGALTYGEKLDVCVPTGNFGNIFACYIAKLMGLPIGKLICASNSNNVLTDFLKCGTYDRNRHFFKTISPSMDILISSNLERLLFLICGAEKTAAYMKELSESGKYTLDAADFEKIKESFVGYYTDEEMTKATIYDAFKNKNCLIDTHTAVAVCAAEQYMNTYKTERKMLVVSTASPYKFAKDVYLSLEGEDKARLFDDDAEAIGALEALSGVTAPMPLKAVTAKKIIHSDIIDIKDMDGAVISFTEN